MSGCVCVKGKRRGYFPLCSDSRVGEGGVGVGGMVFVNKCPSMCQVCVCVKCVCQEKRRGYSPPMFRFLSG